MVKRKVARLDEKIGRAMTESRHPEVTTEKGQSQSIPNSHGSGTPERTKRRSQRSRAPSEESESHE